MTKATLQDRLKNWRQSHSDTYARTLLETPKTTTIPKFIPDVGVILVMGDLGMGKSAEAHTIAETLHKRDGRPVVLHLPKWVPDKLRNRVQSLLPPWVKVVTDRKKWPNGAVVIYDEAALSAHARRTQSKDAVKLDSLLSIARQQGQLILFISHHSRKLDPNIVQQVTQVHWKQPTYAHQLFEREEMQDFSMRAFDFFTELREHRAWKDCTARVIKLVKSTTLALDMQDFRFATFRNPIPDYWSEKLSCAFKDIANLDPDELPEKRGVPGLN